MVFQKGEFVKVHDLKKAPHYNGITAIVVGRMSEEGRIPVQILDHEEGWSESNTSNNKKECGGKLLNVKVSNLNKSEDSYHWKMSQYDNETIYEMIVNDGCYNAGDPDICKSIWKRFYKKIVPSFSFDKEAQDWICSEKMQMEHGLIWLRCDAIMHNILIEKNRGMYRIYQSHEGSYTVKKWCKMQKQNNLKHKNKTWKKYSGGRTVGPEDVNLLIKNIRTIQELIPKLTPYLIDNLTNVSDEMVKDLVLLQQGKANERTAQQGRVAYRIASRFARENLDVFQYEGTKFSNVEFDEKNHELIVLDDKCDTNSVILLGDEECFKIPMELFKEFHTAYFNLTGEFQLQPAIFVKLMELGLLWDTMVEDEEKGYVGFSFISAPLDKSNAIQKNSTQSEILSKLNRPIKRSKTDVICEEIIKGKSMADIYDDYGSSGESDPGAIKLIWLNYVGFPEPFNKFDKEAQDWICSEDEMTKNGLVWLRCDAIMHNILIEKKGGTFDVAQQSLDQTYTALDMCMMEDRDLNDKCQSWKKMSRHTAVGSNHIKQLVESIRTIQELIPLLTPHLLKAFPEFSPNQIRDIGLLQLGNFSEEFRQQAYITYIMLSSFSISLYSKFGYGDVTTTNIDFDEKNGRINVQDESITTTKICCGNEDVFEIPISLYKGLHKAYYNLTGEVYLNPVIFVKMIEIGLLWNIEEEDDEDDYEGFVAFGFLSENLNE